MTTPPQPPENDLPEQAGRIIGQTIGSIIIVLAGLGLAVLIIVMFDL